MLGTDPKLDETRTRLYKALQLLIFPSNMDIFLKATCIKFLSWYFPQASWGIFMQADFEEYSAEEISTWGHFKFEEFYTSLKVASDEQCLYVVDGAIVVHVRPCILSPCSLPYSCKNVIVTNYKCLHRIVRRAQLDALQIQYVIDFLHFYDKRYM